MNLYLIKRTDHVGYDDYDALVVAAESEIKALSIEPEMGWKAFAPTFTIELIGTARAITKAGVVLGSFNAG